MSEPIEVEVAEAEFKQVSEQVSIALLKLQRLIDAIDEQRERVG